MRSFVVALALLSHGARADGVISEHGVVIATAPPDGEARDEPTDLSRALSGLAFGVATFAIGGTAGAGEGVAGSVTFEAASGSYPFGGFTVGRATGWYTPDRGTIRMRATILEVDALFMCRDRDGHLHPPLLGQSRYTCVPQERFGMGGTLGDVAWDPRSGRVAARWGEVLLVANLVGAPSSMAYLSGHVDLALGIAGESVWHGHDDARSGSDHLARGVAKVTGMVRSESAHWDVSLMLVARPALVGTVRALHDVGVVGEGRVRYNVLVGESSAISIGLLAHAAYWADPATSNLALDSVASTSTLFGGVVVEARHESPR